MKRAVKPARHITRAVFELTEGMKALSEEHLGADSPNSCGELAPEHAQERLSGPKVRDVIFQRPVTLVRGLDRARVGDHQICHAIVT